MTHPAYSKTEPEPVPPWKDNTRGSALRHFYERRYMIFVAVAGNGIFYIQATRIVMNESAKDVSAIAFAVSFWAVASWFVYGLIRRDQIIIWANIIAMIGAALVLLGCAVYG